ncbi:acyltransferase family protein [Amaricoccus solimangrovi]|uniref:Acyltransferase n=1 Tax=Amaricoccus solimangrovi TaxID=2589815 RepID=A0A501WN49_9RHOB|nr:acyltransferase family protein [Amaricoccus solimangrovi]TPE48401.1 acyltransferase [Amaricoccus solimangrovi]
MKYRAEIDGLRALAILPVVAFHAGLERLSGGFTGVDVFFVISGFLITTIILGEIEDPSGDRFSILEFYKRRVLRILPALAVVLAATVLAAWAIMLPNEFRAAGRSVVATALFLSNVYFWRTSGYFAATAELKPLLHTWSLAVEEQFYVFFPLMLVFVARFLGRRFRLWIGLMVLVSFGLGVALTPRDPMTAFFLLPSRIWELGLGALIAAGAAPAVGAGPGRGLLAWAGIALIAFGVLGLGEEDPFPGWNALYPVLGAGLVIAYGAGTSAGALLSTAPLVYVGRISYSLYLWHWPVIVFYRLARGQALAPLDILLVLALSWLLADLSFRFVERPFRTRAIRLVPAPRVVGLGLACLAGFLALGGLVNATGAKWRSYPPDVLRIAAYTDYNDTAEHAYQFGEGDGCGISGHSTDGSGFDREKCLRTEPGRPNYLVIGDSHSAAVWRAIALAYPEANVLKASVSGCRPLLDADGEAPCRAIINHVYRDFVPGAHLDAVIMVGRWRATDFPKVAPTLAHLGPLAGRVVVFGPTVEYEGEFPLLLARERMNGVDGVTEAAIDPTKKGLSDALGEIVRAEGVAYVPVYDVLCPGGDCVETAGEDVPMQSDYGHLTFAGAKLLIARIRDDLPLGDALPRRRAALDPVPDTRPAP